jgi:hypothetical protein
MTLAVQIIVYVAAIDGFRDRRSFKTLAGARRYAQERVGATPEFGAGYAVAADGVVTLRVSGATLADLFPATVEVDMDAEFDRVMREEAARERAYALSDARGAALEARRYEPRGPVGCRCSDVQLTQVGCDCGAAERPQPTKKPWPLTARKVDGGRAYAIIEGTATVAFARLTVKSPGGYDVADGFTCEVDEELADWVNHVLRDRSRDRLDLRAKLAIVRECYDALGRQRASEAAAELYAENAWLRAAEAPTNDDLGFEEYEARRLGGF